MSAERTSVFSFRPRAEVAEVNFDAAKLLFKIATTLPRNAPISRFSLTRD
jgi:hypothetical protein